MKIFYERETQKQKHNKQKNQKVTREDRSYNERGRAIWFCCAVKLGFLELICKQSLVFKSNLELVLSIISKQRELYESKHVAVESRCLKMWYLSSFLICSSILA